LKLAAPDVRLVITVPSGFFSRTVTELIVLLVIFTVASRFTTVLLNVTVPFWPGVGSDTVRGDPLIVVVAVTSTKSYRTTVTFPVPAPVGLTTSV
jgi:hypothetical protein